MKHFGLICLMIVALVCFMGEWPDDLQATVLDDTCWDTVYEMEVYTVCFSCGFSPCRGGGDATLTHPNGTNENLGGYSIDGRVLTVEEVFVGIIHDDQIDGWTNGIPLTLVRQNVPTD